jgi:tryptophanyl-tRNA synthetase
MKKRILSGMRPTGKLHLGHLVGALKNWVALQERYECFFMVADWHALMSEYDDPSEIRQNVIDCVADWVSVGIDPERSPIFLQSAITEHLELDMILSDITPLSWLERCPTYKEQLREQTKRDLTTYGFLGYPVLQAADILLYKANTVPIGADQLPHLEITREIARKFNNLYKTILVEPEPLLTKTPKLLGIDNRKMSKSYDNFIALSDPPEVIRQKVARMITDPKRIHLKDPGHPATCNVYSYYKIFKPEAVKEVHDYCTHARVGCTSCKKNLAETIIAVLHEIQEKRKRIVTDKHLVHDILKKGTEKARTIAAETMSHVKKAMQLYEL